MKTKQKQMVVIAFLIAMVVVLQFISSQIPTIGGVSISLVLIPIVMGAAYCGPAAGAILGAAFGMITLFNCMTGSDIGGHMVFQASPLGCALIVLSKSLLAGLAAGWVYRIISPKNGYVAMLCSAIVCPVVNTGVFLTAMALFFQDVLSAWAGGGNILAYVLSGLVLFNFVPELAINVIFCPAGDRILRAINHTK